MNGAQDLGGMQGFGPVVPEADEPVFHAPWEARALALTLAMGASGKWNIDMSRHARERMNPADYLSSSYYQIWLSGLETLMTEAGLVTREEIASGKADGPGQTVAGVLLAADVPAVLARGGPTERETDTPPRFAVGQAVRTLNVNPPTHIRMPRYCRGRVGRIEAVHGPHVFPDTHAHGQGEQPKWLYGVSFDARELWGADAPAGDTVRIDLWEPYLETV